MTAIVRTIRAVREPLWWLTKDGDKSCLALYQRYYSAAKAYADGRNRSQFVGPGETFTPRSGA